MKRARVSANLLWLGIIFVLTLINQAYIRSNVEYQAD